MVGDEQHEPGTGRGRPREPERTAAILRATIELFDEVGYDHLRIQDVADRAGAGLATIYRRWPTKQALLADAIRNTADMFDTPVTGDPQADLTTLFRTFADNACGKRAEFLPGLLTALRAEPEIAQAFRGEKVPELRGRIRAQLELLLGADHPHLELLTDVVPGVVLFRTVLQGVDIDAGQLADEAIQLVLACADASRSASA